MEGIIKMSKNTTYSHQLEEWQYNTNKASDGKE